MSLFRFITHELEPVACLLYFVALLLHFNRSKQKTSVSLLGFYATSTTLLTYCCLREAYNIWVYDLVAFLTTISIGIYFFKILQGRSKKQTVLLLIALYIIYSIIRNLTAEGQRLFDSIGFSIISASVAIYVFMYFHQLLKNVSEISILKDFNFWLSSSYLIYFLGSFIIFVSYYYLTNKIIKTYTQQERDILTALWGLHNVLLFVGALSLLTGSLWVTYRKKSV